MSEQKWYQHAICQRVYVHVSAGTACLQRFTGIDSQLVSLPSALHMCPYVLCHISRGCSTLHSSENVKLPSVSLHQHTYIDLDQASSCTDLRLQYSALLPCILGFSTVDNHPKRRLQASYSLPQLYLTPARSVLWALPVNPPHAGREPDVPTRACLLAYPDIQATCSTHNLSRLYNTSADISTWRLLTALIALHLCYMHDDNPTLPC